MPSNTSFPIDYTNTLPATYTSQWWTPEGTPGLNSTDIWNTDWDPSWDPSFTPGWNTDFGVDFGDTGTTGGNTDFWNQGLGGLGGKLFDFGIAGATAGIGVSAMYDAQKAQQVQAALAAQAIRKKNTWDVGALIAANTNEYERQRNAEKWKRANLNDPNVLWDQERTMLRNAAAAGLKPQDAAHYAFIT